MTRSICLGFCLLLLAACGGGSGGGDRTAYALLDIESGVVYTAASVPDLLSDPGYRRHGIVFRKISASTQSLIGLEERTLFGSPVADDDREEVAVAEFYLAVFELTRGQWRTLEGDDSQPWLDLGPSAATGLSGSVDINPEYAFVIPATGLSFEAVQLALASYLPASGARLRLPSDAEWEHACRAGSTALFAWGNDHGPVAEHAWVWEIADATPGARPGAQLRANAFGLYDLHGNVAEFTDSGRLRGGSWSQSLIEARASGFDAIDSDVAHAVAGFRPVLYFDDPGP